MGKKTTYTEDTLSIISEAEFDAIVNSGWWRQGNGVDQQSWPDKAGDGSLHRFGVVPKIAASSIFFERLDTKEDWRDRLLTVSFAVGRPVAPSGFSSGFSSGFGGPALVNDGALFPGVSEEVSFVEQSEPVIFWTKEGETSPIATLQPYSIELVTGLFLYVDSSNGDLVVSGNGTLTNTFVGLVILIHATDRLGEAGLGVPTSLNEPAPTDGLLVTPGELNAMQDGSLMEQFNGWDVDPNSNADAESMALGPKVTGEAPGIPVKWTPTIRDGTLTTAGGAQKTLTYNRRQRMAGGEVRRARALKVDDGTEILVDNTVDWRDRFIYASGRFSTAEIRPGDVLDVNYNSATLWSGQAYTHVGKTLGATPPNTRHLVTVAALLYLLVDQTTGALYVRNDTGGIRYVGAIVQATPQLGTRREQD